MNHHELEEGSELNLDFTKLKKVANCGEDIIPAVAQDVESGEVLIVGYANQIALDTAQKEKRQPSGAQAVMNYGLRVRPQVITSNCSKFV